MNDATWFAKPMRRSYVLLAALVAATTPACSARNGASAPDARAANDDGGDSPDVTGGDTTDAAVDTGSLDGGTPPAGDWRGLRVSGVGFVDGDGHEVILRGIGPGEWLNIESYMLGLDLSSDSPGLGQTRLRDALVKAMGSSGADQFFASWQANLISEADVAQWASWGVNSVRLPINYHSISSGPGAYIESGFVQIDLFVSWCKKNHIYVILDLHAAPGAQNCEEMGDTPDGIARLWKEPTVYRQWTIDLWRTIAARYHDETAVGGYDILDEPYDTESSGDFSTGIKTLRDFYVDVTAAIRFDRYAQVLPAAQQRRFTRCRHQRDRRSVGAKHQRVLEQ